MPFLPQNHSRQQKSFTFAEYRATSCFQVDDALGELLHRETNGFLCNGCPAYDHCNARKDLEKYQLPKGHAVLNSQTETVRQEALRRNLSINEVRRQRNGV